MVSWVANLCSVVKMDGQQRPPNLWYPTKSTHSIRTQNRDLTRKRCLASCTGCSKTTDTCRVWPKRNFHCHPRGATC